MALKFSLADDAVVAPLAVVGEFFGDDAKNLGLAPLKSDFDRTWTPPLDTPTIKKKNAISNVCRCTMLFGLIFAGKCTVCLKG